MAAVTVNSKKFNVTGNVREQFYNITGATGDTLTVGLIKVRAVLVNPSVITAVSIAKDTPAKGQSRITFTASGAITAQDVVVKGT